MRGVVMKAVALAMLALAACGDNKPNDPVPCGRYDVNTQLECAEAPGVPVPSCINDGDPGIYTTVVDGRTLLVVHNCAEQCSPCPTGACQ